MKVTRLTINQRMLDAVCDKYDYWFNEMDKFYMDNRRSERIYGFCYGDTYKTVHRFTWKDHPKERRFYLGKLRRYTKVTRPFRVTVIKEMVMHANLVSYDEVGVEDIYYNFS